MSKLSPELAKAATGNWTVKLTVVIELNISDAGDDIDSTKASFDRAAAPVEQFLSYGAIQGEILDRVWINGTLIARVATGAIPFLERLDQVRSIDLTRQISLE